MELRKDSMLSLFHQSTGLLEEDVEEVATAQISTPTVNDDREEAAQLSARLLDHVAPPAMSAMTETPPVISASAMTAWNEHLSKLTSLERKIFMDHSRGNLNQYIYEIETICQNRGDASKGKKIAQLFRPWFRTMNQYAPIAQTMIQADPTSSALILGGITCIMSISERYLEFPEKIAETLAEMGEKIDLLTRYGSDVYRNNDSVQCAIVEVFGDILQFCRLALPLFSGKDGKVKGSAHVFAKALMTSFTDHFGDVVKKYETDLRIFEDRAKLCDRSEDRDYRSLDSEVARHQIIQLTGLRADVRSIQQYHASASASEYHFAAYQSQRVKMIEAKHREYEEEKKRETLRNGLIAWLGQSAVRFHADQNTKTMDRLEGTGTWILQNVKYLQWRESSESELLWVNGKRGCGKSFLTSMVVQDLKESCESTENLQKSAKERSAFAFIYCTSLETDKHDLSRLLCSLVEQLSHQLPGLAIDPYLESLYGRHGGSRPLDFDEIRRALESIIGIFKKTYLIIDGLDELRVLEHEQFQEHCQYLRKLTQPRNDDSTVKTMVFSRPEYFVISNAFDGCSQVLIDDGANDEDIEKFIGMKLTSIKLRFKEHPDLLDEIKRGLLTRAEGMFLWVHLVTTSLKAERRANFLLQKVKDLPRGLDRQYTTSLEKIIKNEDTRDIALKILLWITNARVPLRRAELLEALAIQPGMTELTKGDKISDDNGFCEDCDNLIVLDRTKDSYRLLHSSLRDYLTGRSKVYVPEEYSTLQKNADKILGETCLTYLNFAQFGKGPASTVAEINRMMAAHPFLRYASSQWGKHVAAVHDDHLSGLATMFVTVPERRDLSMQLLIQANEGGKSLFTGPSTSLHILAMFDLVRVANTMPDFNKSQAKMDGFSAIPLDYALLYGNRQMCNRLLEGFRDLIAPESMPKSRRFPIHQAAKHGWEEVVRSLVDLKYDAEARFSNENLTALHVAAIQGSTDVLSVLLEKGVNVDARDVDGSTPLLRACEENNSSFAKKLIEAGANVTWSGWNGTTPLHRAAGNGDLELVKKLLQKGADKNAACFDGGTFGTPLHMAAEEGNILVLKHLINEGADLDPVRPQGLTALHLTCIYGHLECLSALLKAGAWLDPGTEDDRTPIHLAAGNGHLDVLKLLFEKRQEQFARLIDKVDQDSRVALHDAALNGHLESTRFLIEKGALCNIRSIMKQTPIHESIWRGNVDIAKLFLKNDPTCVNWKGIVGSPILHYVAYFGAEHPALNELIVPLLQAEADPEATNDDDQAAMHLAMQSDNVQFADVLLEQVPKLKLNALSNGLHTPMYLAAAEGLVKSVEWLLEKNLSLDQPRIVNHDIPMHVAAGNGHFEVLKTLLTPETVNEPGFKGRTALYGASVRGHYEIVKYLLENKADPNLADELQTTPLLASVTYKHIKVANLLLDSKADPYVANTDGNIPLHCACSIGDEDLVRRLLKAKCNPLHRNRYGDTPFMVALSCTNPYVLEIFVEDRINGWHVPDHYGATSLHALANFGSLTRLRRYQRFFNIEDFRAVDCIGRNALFYAAKSGHADMLEALIISGVPIQGADDSLEGPLHEAASEGHLDAVQELITIRHNIIPIDENRGLEGRTALHVAVSTGLPAIAGTLIQAGANPLSCDMLGLNSLDYASRHPQLWKDTALSTMGYQSTELTTRMPRLTEVAQKVLEKLLNLPDELTSQDEYYRVDCLRVLANVLLEMDTAESVDKSLVCFLAAAMPGEFPLFGLYWRCGLCGQDKFFGAKYICNPSKGRCSLCDVCYPEYDKGDGLPKSTPKSVKILEALQKKLKPVRQALAPFIALGTKFIITVWTALPLSESFLDEEQKSSEEWTKRYNHDSRFHDRKLADLKFLDWLKKGVEAVVEKDENETEKQIDNKTLAVNMEDRCEHCSAVIQPHKPSKATGEDDDNPFERLDRELCILFRDNRPDQELPLFACEDHEFSLIPTMDTASEEQKKCFGEDGRIRKDWLIELRDWLEKVIMQHEDKQPLGDNQTDSIAHNQQISVATPAGDAARDAIAGGLDIIEGLTVATPNKETNSTEEDAMASKQNHKDMDGFVDSKRGTFDEKPDIEADDSQANRKDITVITQIRQSILDSFLKELRKAPRSDEQLRGTDELVSKPEEKQAPKTRQSAFETHLASEPILGTGLGSMIETEQPSQAMIPTVDDVKSMKPMAFRKETELTPQAIFADPRKTRLLMYEASWRVAQAILLGDVNQKSLQDMAEKMNSDN